MITVTESEWLACTDPAAMLEVVSDPQPGRKHWLFNCACGRLVWGDLSDERLKRAVEAAEAYVDDPLYEKAWESSYFAAWKLLTNTRHPRHPDFLAGYAAFVRHNPATEDMHRTTFEVVSRFSQARGECASLCPVLRDVFGNPFRQKAPAPAWLTTKVMTHAQAIYDHRSSDQLPALAEALEEAGCQDQDILSHCRSKQEHVRGCWLIDLLLGKE